MTMLSNRVLLLVAIGLLLILVGYLMRPTPAPAIPRIVDEHGNDLLYRCPGDPRCTPRPWPTRAPG